MKAIQYIFRKSINQRAMSVAAPRQMQSTQQLRAKTLLREADCVCFDVDSTVTQEEGIDVLADLCGKGKEVAELTKQAMGGQVTFQDALAARLKLIQPTQSIIEELLRCHTTAITPGMSELMDLLRARKKKIVFVSGGFIPLIRPVAKKLGVHDKDIYAIDLYFDESNGKFRDFDRLAPTARSGGKQKVMELLKQQGYKTIVMIGDGATDLETRPIADAVIGFGANAVREKVLQESDWFVYSTGELIEALNNNE